MSKTGDTIRNAFVLDPTGTVRQLITDVEELTTMVGYLESERLLSRKWLRGLLGWAQKEQAAIIKRGGQLGPSEQRLLVEVQKFLDYTKCKGVDDDE